MKNLFQLVLTVFCLSLPMAARADLSLPHFFSDHMVLQRERTAAIWGQASPNAAVIVSFKMEFMVFPFGREVMYVFAFRVNAANTIIAKGNPK